MAEFNVRCEDDVAVLLANKEWSAGYIEAMHTVSKYEHHKKRKQENTLVQRSMICCCMSRSPRVESR